MVIKHIPGDINDADIFTKNVTAAVFNCHIPMYVGVDKYLDQTQALCEEAVPGNFNTRTQNGGSTRIFDSGWSRVFLVLL